MIQKQLSKTPCLKHLTTVAIIVLLVRCSTLFLIDLSNILLYWTFGFCLAIFSFYLLFKYRKDMVFRKNWLSFLLEITVIIICLLPIDKYLRIMRFYIWKPAYEAIATQVVEQTHNYKGDFPLNLPERCLISLSGTVTYQKSESETVICFPIHTNFFKRYDFVYITSPNMEDFKKHPSKLTALLFDEGLVVSSQFINRNWIYVEYR